MKQVNCFLTTHQQSLITNELIGFADAMAHQYIGCGLDLDDLKQEARYGLCQAALHFNEQAGTTLKTFATYYIKKYIIKAIETYGTLIRVRRDDRALLQIVSLDVELSDGGSTGADYVEDTTGDSPCEGLAQTLADTPTAEEDTLLQNRQAMLTQAMLTLTPKERRAVEMIFGLDGTQLQVRDAARMLAIRPERFRGIYNKAMAKLELYGYGHASASDC